MARPKKFDRDAALGLAIDVFAEHGFAGTSTDTLLTAMDVSRQSLYDTYGSKKSLYLEALRRYNRENVARIAGDIARAPTPLAGLELALTSLVQDSAARPNASCLGVSSTLEFGLRDADVLAAAAESHSVLMAAVRDAVRHAQSNSQIRSELDVNSVTDFLVGMFAALKVSARGGMPLERLQRIGKLAIQALS